jgi:RimJ/RimL family protein N-acetyltransferase
VLICSIDDATELHRLERQHTDALECLEPGDLSLAQGEWIFPKGGAANWVADALREFIEGTRLEACIFRGSALLGLIALHNIDRHRGSADIDYAMDSRYRNQGIVTRACRALIDYAFTEVALSRIQICPDTANLPSLRVPEKLGFTKEGVLRAHYRAAGGYRDCALYSIVKAEWDRDCARPLSQVFETIARILGLTYVYSCNIHREWICWNVYASALASNGTKVTRTRIGKGTVFHEAKRRKFSSTNPSLSPTTISTRQRRTATLRWVARTEGVCFSLSLRFEAERFESFQLVT